jgi:outer membrane protein assembly factor BamD
MSRRDHAGDRLRLPAVYSIGGARPIGWTPARKGVLLFVCRRSLALIATLALLAGAAACHHSSKSKLPPPGSIEEDRFLFDKGTALLQDRNWITAREYFKKLIDTYPQSVFRHDARLGIGDSYIGEGRTDSYILAVNEFRQFLQLAPLNPKADYAQYKICLAQSKQMLGSQRDQTATRDTLTECDAFLRNYPNSALRPQVEEIRRKARDRLSDYEFQVGLTYFRQRMWAGADSRFREVLSEDPKYTRMDQVYYYLAETLYRGSGGQRAKEALPLFDKVIKEFPKSDYAKKAQKRVTEINQVKR